MTLSNHNGNSLIAFSILTTQTRAILGTEKEEMVIKACTQNSFQGVKEYTDSFYKLLSSGTRNMVILTSSHSCSSY